MATPPPGPAHPPGCLRLELRQRLAHFSLDLELACAPGQVLALVGPSGAGKTTLLRLVAGLERLQEGFISLGGRDWTRQPGGLHLAPGQRRVGMVFQDYPLFPHLGLLRNVAFAAAEPGQAPALLERFGIAHLAERLPGAVSGGERQRAAICQALARRPAVLLLDEPFSALDVDTRALARRCFRETAAQWGICLIMVTHDLLDAVSLGGRVEALLQGRLDRRWLDSRLLLLSREVAGLTALADTPANP
ncbi:MAG: ATP-binding cassette domain-containing protein [Pseudomonadota bacterium]